MSAQDKSTPKTLLKCALPQCKGLRFALFHRFPRNHEKCKAWLEAFDNATLYAIPHSRLITMAVCSRHFRVSDYNHPESRKLNAVAVPNLNLKTLNQLDMCRHGKTIKVDYPTERWPRDLGNTDNTEEKENDVPNTTKEEPEEFDRVSLASEDTTLLHDNLVSSSEDIKEDATLVATCVEENNGFELVVHDGFIQMKDSQLDSVLQADILWMRHICHCSECFDSKENKPLIEFFELDQDLQPVMATVIEETRRLDIIWSDGHTSSYNLTELYEKLQQKLQPTAMPNYLLWNFQHTQYRDDLQPINFYELLQANKSGIYKALDRLQKSGVLIINQVPTNDEDSLMKKSIITKLFNLSSKQIINEKRHKFLGQYKAPFTNCTFESMDKGLQILINNKEHLKLQLNLVDGFQAIEQLPKATQEFLTLNQMDYSLKDDKGFIYKIKQPILWKSEHLERIWFNPYHLVNINSQDFRLIAKHFKQLGDVLKMPQNQWLVELNADTIIMLDIYRICWCLKDVSMDSELDCMYLERKHYLSSLNILKNI